MSESEAPKIETPEFEAPIARWQETIRPEWMDYNGHMNVAYYTLIFHNGTDVFYPLVGLGKPYREETGNLTSAVQCHITYVREAHVGEEIKVATQLLGYTDKALHYIHTMTHAEEGYLIATLEQLALHIDRCSGKARVTPFPEKQQQMLADMMAAHADLPIPPQVGNVMALRKK